MSSSSSSSSLSSSSSSIEYSSSSSSSSFKYSSSSNSSNSSNSSSSSIEYSSSSFSSSSSSYLDYNGAHMIQFSYGEDSIKPVWKLAYANEYIFAGTGDGKLLRSSNGHFWEEFYKTDDVHIKAIYVYGNKLFFGTSPHGYAYMVDLTTFATTFLQTIGSSISGFFDINNETYLTTSNPSGIYKYNKISGIWDFYYKPYGDTIYKTLKMDTTVLIFINKNQVISFDGNNFNLVII